MQVCLKYRHENEIRKGRWNRLIEELQYKFEDLLLDWTLQICCFRPKTPFHFNDFLTKHKKYKIFRAWYSIFKLDSEQEIIKYELEFPYIESWHKKTEKQKIDNLVVDLIDIFKKEGSRWEYKYFGNKKTTKILKTWPVEVKKFYERNYEGWLYLQKPLK